MKPLLSAAGIGELVRLEARLRESGGRLVLVNVGEAARRALAASDLTEAFGCGVVRPAAEGAEARGEDAGCACGKT